MREYQHYLENIINALSRVGISFPVTLDSYEDLFLSSESLGVFLEINSYLQRVGSGFRLFGFDESLTYKSYWASEFYLEYQERKYSELAYFPKNETTVLVSDNLSSNDNLDEPKEEQVLLVNYSPITGTDDYGLDVYGVSAFEDENIPASSEVDMGTEPSEEPTFSEITSTDDYGLDVYGTYDSIEEGVEDEDITDFEANVEDEDDTDFEVNNSDDIIVRSEEAVYKEIESVDDYGLDVYGSAMDDTDEGEQSDSVIVNESYDDFSEEDEYFDNYDPDDPDNGSYVEESVEYVDEEYDPDDPDNFDGSDLVDTLEEDTDYFDDYGYTDSQDEESSDFYDEDYDPDDPDNFVGKDLVESESDEEVQEDTISYYEEEYDPDDPDNFESVDISSQYLESVKDIDSYSSDILKEDRVVQQRKVVPQKTVSSVKRKRSDIYNLPKGYDETDNILDFLGNMENKILKRFKTNGNKK